MSFDTEVCQGTTQTKKHIFDTMYMALCCTASNKYFRHGQGVGATDCGRNGSETFGVLRSFAVDDLPTSNLKPLTEHLLRTPPTEEFGAKKQPCSFLANQ